MKSPGKKKKQSDQLNPREARAVALLKSGKAKTKKDALIRAGYTEQTADKAAKGVLGKPRVQSALLSAFAKIGINDTYLAERHKVLIDADEHQAVSKGIDMAYKLRGEYAPEKVEHSGAIDVSSESDQVFSEWMRSAIAMTAKKGDNEKP
jgi:DNA-binding CsgD family transcriptional regulator